MAMGKDMRYEQPILATCFSFPGEFWGGTKLEADRNKKMGSETSGPHIA